MTEIDVDRLSSVAQQFVGRVHDDDPIANRRWLHAQTTADEREALLYLLAAAVPDDRSWGELVAWTGEELAAEERRRAQWRIAKRRARERAA